MDNFSKPKPGLREQTTRGASTREATIVDWRRGAVLISAATSMAIAFGGCGRQKELPIAVDDTSQSIIGGFAANDPVLDAIGSLVIHFGDFGFSQELCGATLISPESILTAKHCAQAVSSLVSLGYLRLTFAIGPVSTMPRREVNVVAIETAPGDVGGVLGIGHDVAVMHLESPILDIIPVELSVLSDDQIGQPFAAIGYGIQDNSGLFGTRRLGKQTLRARQGRIFEILFGSFDAFFDWFLNGTAPEGASALADGGSPPVDGGKVGRDGGDGGGAGGAGGGTAGDGGIFPPPPPSLEDIARQIYDSNTLDPGYEVVTGGVAGDAQPCFGDSGSSLIRRQGGKFYSYAVTTAGIGTRDAICDLGTIYSSFGPDVLDFLMTARQWTDPCGDLNSLGACNGDTAVRCTALNEGRRRIVSFDCSSLGMACNIQGQGGQVSCDDNAIAPPPPQPPVPGQPDPVKEANRVFLTPATLLSSHTQ